MLVGHDPDLSTLLGYLIDAAGVSLRKGALATVDLTSRLGDGDGVLRWLVPPDLLEGRE
jgi:phosphohistidine phosphatase SixA